MLSQGTQNQYGEMAVAARAEFLVMQSILAEPQMREFLGGRPMTPYPEAWMDRVDTHEDDPGLDRHEHHALQRPGRRSASSCVLTIRLGNWADTGRRRRRRRPTWAQAFRNGIQKYAAAYRTATGVDLAAGAQRREAVARCLARRLSGARIRA